MVEMGKVCALIERSFIARGAAYWHVVLMNLIIRPGLLFLLVYAYASEHWLGTFITR